MQTTRRNFIKNLSSMAIGGGLLSDTFMRPLLAYNGAMKNYLPATIGSDEDFWQWVRTQYIISEKIINFNNGGVSPQPIPVQEVFKKLYTECNEGPSYFMWRKLDSGREALRQNIATTAGATPEEIAIHRNTTEALANIVFGLAMHEGDEVVLTHQDYPNMINAWKQRELRDRIVLKWINLQLPEDDDDKIVAAFVDAFTSRTKLVHITHVINWTGQILPVKRIAEEAKKRDILVLVDGAHSFAQMDFLIPELNCDFFATSLHKWLGAPFGSGFLYVRKDKIKSIWPLMPNDAAHNDEIKKFEALGTRNLATEYGILAAIEFHNAIGIQRKQARLKFLKTYWTEKVAHLPGVLFNTSLIPEKSNAIANVIVEGWTPYEMESVLMEKYKIHCTSIVWANISGIRITPNIYTSLVDLDTLAEGLQYISKSKPTKKP